MLRNYNGAGASGPLPANTNIGHFMKKWPNNPGMVRES